MINPLDTFHYFAVVPDSPVGESAVWPLQRREKDRHEIPLGNAFGPAPTLRIIDADPPANANALRPWVLRSRFTLDGNGRRASFHIDRSITARLAAGDVIHIVRTERGGLGLSVLRNERLVVALGAISAVPLGEGISARIAPEMHDLAVSREVPLPGLVKESRKDEWPLDIRIGGAALLFFRRCENIEGYHLNIRHGLYVRASRRKLLRSFWTGRAIPKPETVRGVDGIDESATLTRNEESSWVGANASALLLETDGLEEG